MSEENQTPVETPVESTNPPESKTIEIDGNSYSAEDIKSALYEANTKVETLENYRNNASKLLKSEFADEADRLQSVKYLLQQEGYNQEQISNYINALNQTEQEPIEGAEMQETPAQPEPQPINNPEYEQALNYQQERINQLEAQQKKVNTQSLKADLNIAVDNSFKNNNDMKILLQKLNSINGSEGNDARLDLMKQEIMTETMNNLRNRKNAGGIFDKSWFAEETNRATDSVVAKFRTVIGDPNRIQRAPETASELHSFINSKPVEPPKYESGDRVMGKGDTKAKQYTNDALSRLAAEINLGGETRA